MSNSIEDSTQKTEIGNKINDQDRKKNGFDNTSSSNDKQKEWDLNTNTYIKNTGLFIDGMHRTLKELQIGRPAFQKKRV